MLGHSDKVGNGEVTMDDFYRLMEKQQSSKLELLKVAAEANRNSGDVHSRYPSVYAKSVA